LPIFTKKIVKKVGQGYLGNNLIGNFGKIFLVGDP